MNSHAQQLKDWERQLGHGTILDDVNKLVYELVDPKTADAETCWQVVWSKPLFANTKVAIGRGMITRLEPLMKGAWRTWGTPNGPVAVTHLGGTNKRDNFRIIGSQAQRIDALRIGPHRLLAIQGAANALRLLVEMYGENPPFARFSNMPLGELVSQLQRDFGRGWGPITVLHLLTDFGLAVKPDLHLVRSVKSLGLLSSLGNVSVPNFKQALQINEIVREIAEMRYGADYSPSKLRFVDGLLMEASRQGLLPTIPRAA